MGKQIQLDVPEGYSWFFARDLPHSTEQRLIKEFRYRPDNVEHVDSYKSGDWDGWINVYSEDHSGGPAGLIGRATEIIEGDGHEVVVNWEGDRTGDPVDLSWEFEHSLRPYQKEAVMAITAENGGVVSLPTGTGKTITALNYCFMEQSRKGRPVVFVHSKNLLYQWEENVRDVLGVEPGLIGDGQCTEGPVTIAIMQSLLSRGVEGTLTDDYGIGIWDECHITSGADQMKEIRQDIDIDVSIGLSATPWRSVDGEEIHIEGVVGSETYTATAEEMIADKYMARPVIRHLDHAGPTPSGNDYNKAYENCITDNGQRNARIINEAKNLATNGRKVLVSVDRLDHGDNLHAGLIAAGLDGERVYSVYGDDDNEKREMVFDMFSPGDVLISTLLREGVDVTELDGIIIAHGQKSDITTIQTMGRALRPTGSDSAMISHVDDEGRWFGRAAESRKNAMVDYYGKYYNE